MGITTIKACAAVLFLLAHTSAFAQGFRDWRFGMSKAEVTAVGDATRYYRFKNGDLGAQGEPFEDRLVSISFYFGDGKLTRVMLIPYMGTDPAKALDAWQDVYTHMKRRCSVGELHESLAAFEAATAKLAQGQRHQMGCHPMPSGVRLWASALRTADGSLMISVNYGEP
ncbi:hypothetical protein [Pseudoduganella sp. OTU4001]|uniref:hypothetical protein n=1 Tax=Pseudoduganella sp. OTU4001 TaxID=3043854 RepID=UPI00313DFC6D